MKAARLHAYGSVDQLRVDDVPDPEPGPRDVLIEVHAAAVNPVDWKIRKGGQRAVMRPELPHILGLDCSGVVVAKGRQVTRFEVGDEVYSSPTHRRAGTYAEYVCIDESEVGRKPNNLSHEEAAGFPLAGLTAWQALKEHGRLQAGQRVFIQAGAGGVGSLAIQMAHALGAYVITTCSERNIDFVKELGADEVINYREENYDEVLRDCDVVLDALGGEDKFRARTVLRRGGRLVSIVGGIPQAVDQYGPVLGLVVAILRIVGFTLWSRLRYGVRVSHALKRCDGRQLDELAGWFEDGRLKPLIDRVFPLAEIAEAHLRSESGRARGKIIIAVR